MDGDKERMDQWISQEQMIKEHREYLEHSGEYIDSEVKLKVENTLAEIEQNHDVLLAVLEYMLGLQIERELDT